MKYLTTILLLSSLFIFNCEGLKGPEGPEGPQGSQGAQGPPGEDGADGQDGADGSANVESFTFQYVKDDVYFDPNDPNLAYISFDISAITQEVVDSGMINAYYNNTLSSNTAWWALPYTRGYDDDGDGQVDVVIDFSYAYSEGEAYLVFYNTSNNGILQSDLLDGRVRFVVIPPSEVQNNKANSTKLHMGLEKVVDRLINK